MNRSNFGFTTRLSLSQAFFYIAMGLFGLFSSPIYAAKNSELNTFNTSSTSISKENIYLLPDLEIPRESFTPTNTFCAEVKRILTAEYTKRSDLTKITHEENLNIIHSNYQQGLYNNPDATNSDILLSYHSGLNAEKENFENTQSDTQDSLVEEIIAAGCTQ